jgi:glycosyltransferase involved in cell wall biosynthesis
MQRAPRTAVVIPCFDEAATIGQVVADFRAALPEAEIHVFDNASTDRTGELAAAAGAIVHRVPQRGKGPVVRAMFRDVDADYYVMVDGDDTYPADRVKALLAPLYEGRAEMVVGTRLDDFEARSFRPLHVLGNNLILNSINMLFDARLTDAMSGYRAFSRRFVKTLPVLSSGFEIETEITVHALEHRLPIVEVPVPYGERPTGSSSKLRTFHDGYRVLRTILQLYKDHRPLDFFGAIGLVFLVISGIAGVAVVLEFLEYRQVIGVARAVLAVACGVIGVVSIATGAILDTVNRRARELYVLLADQVIDRGGPFDRG